MVRSLVRLFQGGSFVEDVADRLLRRSGIEDSGIVFARLEQAGYLAKVEVDDHGYVWWEATILGNALAMASFGKPISRKTADRLVSGLVDRTREYKADDGRPLFMAQIRIFGNYLQQDIDQLGDVDVELSSGSASPTPKQSGNTRKPSGAPLVPTSTSCFSPRRRLSSICGTAPRR